MVAAVPEFDVPASQEVGVEMGEKDVVNVPAVRGGVVQILVNIACGSTTTAVPVASSAMR